MKDKCLICGAKLQLLENDTEMKLDKIKRIHSAQNNTCNGVRCPFKMIKRRQGESLLAAILT